MPRAAATARSARSASRARAGHRLRQPHGPHRQGLHPRLPGHRGQPVRPHLPHRRPGSGQRQRRDRVPRPDRPAGQDPRLPDRAHRDRVRAAAGAGRRRRGRRHLRARRGPEGARGLLQRPRRHGHAGPEHDHGAPARAAAALHGARLPRAARRDPDDRAGQGRPARAARPDEQARGRLRGRARGPGHRDRARTGRGAGQEPGCRQGLGGEPLLRRPGRQLAAAHPVLRPHPQGDLAHRALDPRDLPAPDDPEAGPHRRRRAGSGRGAGRVRTAGPQGQRGQALPVRHRAAADLPRRRLRHRLAAGVRAEVHHGDRRPGADRPAVGGATPRCCSSRPACCRSSASGCSSAAGRRARSRCGASGTSGSGSSRC